MTNHPLIQESVWLDQSKFEDAERMYQEALSGTGGAQRCSGTEIHLAKKHNKPRKGKGISKSKAGGHASTLVNEIVEARQKIQKALTTPGGSGGVDGLVLDRLTLLEKENKDLKKVTENLRSLVIKLESRVISLERGAGVVSGSTTTTTLSMPAAQDDDDDDDDFDLFGDDPEAEAAAEELKQERLKAYADKKAKKVAVIAKSSLLIDVKPWDDETDMAEVEKCVRTIKMDGLLWGTSKLVPVGYGIKKLQITCVIEDAKVSTDDLEEAITAFEDLIQSMDIAAFNKV